MHHGSCLCGAIHYEVRGELGTLYFCHCARCRKANGSAYAANVAIAANDFVVTRGEHTLKAFTRNGVQRFFCAECGSPLISRRDSHPDIVRLRIGTLDSPVNTLAKMHIYVKSKADWDLILDDLPQYAELPPIVSSPS